MNDETPQYLAYFNPLALSMDLQLYRGNKIAEPPSLLCPSLKSQSDTTWCYVQWFWRGQR